MTARLLVGDTSGRILAELEADIGPLSWRLNDVGRVQFGLARGDAKATPDHLRFGNRVLIEFDNGLPDWGGMIDPPRDWDGSRIWSTAYSGEYLLSLRQTDRGRYFSASSVGYIFERLIVEAADLEDLGLSTGEVFGGGDTHSPEYHFQDLLTIVRDSLCGRISTFDFDVRPVVSGGVIRFEANLYERRGAERATVALIEGHNLSQVYLSEQGPIVNWWDLAGAGNVWGSERLTAHAEDAASRATYGLRQGSAVYSSVSVEATLEAHADNSLAESKDPKNIFTLAAVDRAPGLFADYGVGDSVRLIAPSFGFGGTDTTVRILAREFDPSSGACALVVEEEV